MASFMRKPCILVILVPLAEFIFLAPNVSGFVPYRFGRISVRCTRQSMQVQSEWGFGLERVLQAAHDAWERRKTGERYKKVLDPEWSIDVSKVGRIDFLGIGSGKDAWEAFAKDHATDMHNSTRARLERPHFLIAETGLTGKTLMRKFKENRTTLKFMQDVVSSLQSKNINAVKCLVYDAVDAEGLATSEAAAKFLNESGILISIPYLTAETVLGKFDEIGKVREELRELLSLISGLKNCHAAIARRTNYCFKLMQPWPRDIKTSAR